jgi:hypothetical protein
MVLKEAQLEDQVLRNQQPEPEMVHQEILLVVYREGIPVRPAVQQSVARQYERQQGAGVFPQLVLHRQDSYRLAAACLSMSNMYRILTLVTLSIIVRVQSFY